MILELDLGNSRSKWRLLDNAGLALDRGAWPSPLSADQLVALPDNVEKVRICSVRGEAIDLQVRDVVQARWGLDPEFAAVAAVQCGLSNAYVDPAKMGVDRWLAMLAAWTHCRQSCCVVSAGTATTIDLVEQGGAHLGGYILPGIHMMAAALQSGTGRVRFDAEDRSMGVEPGRDTGQAVKHGACLATVGAIALARRRLGEIAVCYLTGGDAPLLGAYVAEPLRCVPELVLDGLAIHMEQ